MPEMKESQSMLLASFKKKKKEKKTQVRGCAKIFFVAELKAKGT